MITYYIIDQKIGELYTIILLIITKVPYILYIKFY